MSIRSARLAAVVCGTMLIVGAAVLAPPAQALPPVNATLVQHQWSVDISWSTEVTPARVILIVHSALDCTSTGPGIALPTTPSGSTMVAAGTLVESKSGSFPLPPGTYGFTVEVSHADILESNCVVGTVAYPTHASPPSWWQSYGRASAEQTCLAGWSPSWAEWMNGGKGGYVCSREEYYDTSTGEWAFR